MEVISRTKEKIVGFDDLPELLAGHHFPKIVQCHGVFDLLHIGHIKHFQTARSYGDILIVTLTPDHYVNKGPDRPRFTAMLRAEAIAALDCVDYVIINKWPTATEAIHLIKPSYYVKGSEYRDPNNDITAKISSEAEAVKAVGGQIAFTDDITFSSSALLNRFFSPFSQEVMDYLEKLKKRFDAKAILKFFHNAEKLKVLVIGEAIIDIYHFSEVIGKAGKEPTLVAKETHEKTYAGGILALANHLSDFCAEVSCLTYLGEKAEYQEEINSSLKSNINLVSIYKKNSPMRQ